MIRIAFKLINKLRKSFSKKIFLVKIEGLSCFPDLLPNKIYLAQNISRPKIGQYVVFQQNKKILVKKLIAQKKEKFILRGKIGSGVYTIPAKKVLGTVYQKINFS